MGDIDFEEQLELERLEKEKKEKEEKGPPGVKVDPDGTKYEWDPERQAWFPKVQPAITFQGFSSFFRTVMFFSASGLST